MESDCEWEREREREKEERESSTGAALRYKQKFLPLIYDNVASSFLFRSKFFPNFFFFPAFPLLHNKMKHVVRRERGEAGEAGGAGRGELAALTLESRRCRIGHRVNFHATSSIRGNPKKNRTQYCSPASNESKSSYSEGGDFTTSSSSSSSFLLESSIKSARQKAQCTQSIPEKAWQLTLKSRRHFDDLNILISHNSGIFKSQKNNLSRH